LGAEAGTLFIFVCECADASCAENVKLTLAEFDTRRRSHASIIAPDHLPPLPLTAEGGARSEITLHNGVIVCVARDPIVVIGDLTHYADLGRGFLTLVDEDGETHRITPGEVASVRRPRALELERGNNLT
jgi:hypothetical protein